LFSCQLVERYGYSRIPGDALVLAFQETFPHVGIGHEIAGLTPEEAYLSTCGEYGRFVVNFLNALNLDSTLPYVLDTFHVRPADLAGLELDKIQVLFFGYPDIDAQTKTLEARAYEMARYGGLYGWVADEISAVAAKFELFIQMSRELQAECATCGFPFINTSQSFSEAIESAVALATRET